MDKLLSAQWCKSQGFPTKMDTMAYINSHDKLKTFLDKKSEEIDEYRCEKVGEFEEYFDKFDQDKQVYLIRVKDAQKERILNKKELQKKAMKEEMREEILREIKEEEDNKNLMIIKEKYAEMYPSYDKDKMSEMVDIDILFRNAINKMKESELSDSEIEDIKKMKDQVEKAFSMLTKVSKKMSKYIE